MEFDNKSPIYLQVVDDICDRLISGEISPGDKLPSSRELAVTYGVNPNTAARVYSELEARGITYTKRGIGTFVTEDAAMAEKVKDEKMSEVVGKFIEQMKNFGVSREELIEIIKNYKEME